MKLKLDAHWTGKLLKYPETGMGYQRVDVVLNSGQVIKSCTVLNAEDLVLPEQYSCVKLEEIVDLIVVDKEK